VGGLPALLDHLLLDAAHDGVHSAGLRASGEPVGRPHELYAGLVHGVSGSRPDRTRDQSLHAAALQRSLFNPLLEQFNGISIPVDSVIWPFRALCYATPYRWGQAALTYVAFIDSPDYDGAVPCNSSHVLPYPCNMAYPDAEGNGFYCPHLPPAACYGRTGAQILTSLGANFQTINARNEWVESTVFMFAQAVVWKALFWLLMVWRSTRSQAPTPPASSAAGSGDGHACGTG
jgi:hypothetical protein